MTRYEYAEDYVTHPAAVDLGERCTRWARDGWRLVAVVPHGEGSGITLLFGREVAT